MLNFNDKSYLITGISNKKSVAYFTAKSLLENGAKLLIAVQNEEQLERVQKLFPNTPVIICDVESSEDFNKLTAFVKKETQKLDGILHSIAFANFNPEKSKYHETSLADFLQATHISCFSLNQYIQATREILGESASVVTVGISNTRATNYGYLGPIKAMLEASVSYLAKSLSHDSQIRVNCVGSGPLKTSASAGIPDYIDNYLYAEALTLRKQSLKTQEVADTICYLLSDKSSGINGQNIIVDAGMNVNYFDESVVKKFNQPD